MRLVVLLLLALLPACRCAPPPLVRSCVEEVCDGVDNDCDEEVDEGLGEIVCGTGICRRTTPACVDGARPTCQPGVAGVETCNGEDDDCNGLVDDGFDVVRCGVGACAREVAVCAAGVEGQCVPGEPVPETCNDADDDCDGEVDEGLQGETCGVGACRRVVSLCDATACEPGMPATETCNGIDDDCDGQIDEGLCVPPTVSCGSALVARVGTTVTLTSTASGNVASSGWSVEQAPMGSTAMPSGSTFTPDVAGTYRLEFCARSSEGGEACCTTELTVSSCMSPPPSPAGTACGTSWDGRPIISLPPVPAGQVVDVVDASGMRLATAASGSNWVRPMQRIARGGPVPGVATTVQVRTCLANDLACCSTGTPVTINVVEACTTPIAPTTTNVVLSEYVIAGEGSCNPADCFVCQAGEAVEITNLSNCPVTLDGTHFKYRNANASTGSVRWMNFGAAEIIPPRGVYVAIRGRQHAPLCSASLPMESPNLFGLKVSTLAMQGDNLCSGWFNNTGGGMSEMHLAVGTVMAQADLNFATSNVLTRVAPYQSSSGACISTGFDAVDSCGTVVGGAMPTATLNPNQLGRLWHPCDAVVGATPTCVRD